RAALLVGDLGVHVQVPARGDGLGLQRTRLLDDALHGASLTVPAPRGRGVLRRPAGRPRGRALRAAVPAPNPAERIGPSARLPAPPTTRSTWPSPGTSTPS